MVTLNTVKTMLTEGKHVKDGDWRGAEIETLN